MLALPLLDKFKQRVAARLAVVYPEKAQQLGEAGVRDLVEHGIGWGAQYGIKTERDVSALIDFMLEYGRQLENHPGQPRLAALMSSTQLSGGAKMTFVRALATPR